MTKLNNKKGSGNINLDLGEKYFENSLESILTFYNKYKKNAEIFRDKCLFNDIGEEYLSGLLYSRGFNRAAFSLLADDKEYKEFLDEELEEATKYCNEKGINYENTKSDKHRLNKIRNIYRVNNEAPKIIDLSELNIEDKPIIFIYKFVFRYVGIQNGKYKYEPFYTLGDVMPVIDLFEYICNMLPDKECRFIFWLDEENGLCQNDYMWIYPIHEPNGILQKVVKDNNYCRTIISKLNKLKEELANKYSNKIIDILEVKKQYIYINEKDIMKYFDLKNKEYTPYTFCGGQWNKYMWGDYKGRLQRCGDIAGVSGIITERYFSSSYITFKVDYENWLPYPNTIKCNNGLRGTLVKPLNFKKIPEKLLTFIKSEKKNGRKLVAIMTSMKMMEHDIKNLFYSMNKLINKNKIAFIVRFIDYFDNLESSEHIFMAKDLDENYIDFQSIAQLVDIWCNQFGNGSITPGIINALPQIRLKEQLYKKKQWARDKPHHEHILYKYGICSSKLYKNEYSLLEIKNNQINLNNINLNNINDIYNYNNTYENIFENEIKNLFDKI